MQSELERGNLRRDLKRAVSAGKTQEVISVARKLLALSAKPADYSLCASAFVQVADQLLQSGAKRLRAYWVRSVTVEPLLPYIVVEAALSGYVLDFDIGGYGSYADELLNRGGKLARFEPDLVFISLDLEDVAGALAGICADGAASSLDAEMEGAVTRVENLVRSFRGSNSARIVLQGFVVPDFTSLGEVADANLIHSLRHAVQQLNLRLVSLCNNVSDCVFFDVDHVAARFGRSRWEDKRMFMASRLAVSADASPEYARSLIRSFSVLFRPPRKVLCVDLDNTLWGGILGEDGPDGILTGSAFPGNCYLEFQRYLKHLSARGILLVIASKNDEHDVREVFQRRASDLALKLDDFVAMRINWKDKSDSIREIAGELSLGVDSFVFVDDSAAECAAIRQQLPEVAVVDVPATEPWRLVEAVAKHAFFDVRAITPDDLGRAGEYRAETRRADFERRAISRDEFLADMKIVCTYLSVLDAPLARAVQLLTKTNQFNLTTRRYSASEIERFASAPSGQAIAVRVRDRFGDSGVVGLALARVEGETCVIDSLLLSCRVIGRGIESALLAQIAAGAIRAGARRLIGEFIPTKKNQPCASFYADHGFKALPRIGENGQESLLYELDLKAHTINVPIWITTEGDEINECATGTVVSS